MRRTFIIASMLALLAAVPAKADKVLDAFSAKAATSYVDFNYSFAVKSDVPLSGKGSGTVKGGSYHVTGSGLDIWCDGKNRWTVDKAAKEVIIESLEGYDDAFAVNPALFLTDLSASFKEVSAAQASYHGKTYHCVTLAPKVSGSITELKIYFSGNDIKGASMKTKDGTVTEFELSDVKFTDTEKAFTFDVKALDKTWVITDLSDF